MKHGKEHYPLCRILILSLNKTFNKLNPVIKLASKIIGISILILSLIYLIFMELFSIIKSGGVFDLIYAFLSVVLLFVITYLIISTISSYKSYRTFRSDSKRHYTKLKELIIKSNNYSDFQLNYNAQFRTKQNVNPSAYDTLDQKLNNLYPVNETFGIKLVLFQTHS